ncbi:manganese efflux pump [bacterium]|nr:manganese efflux pump [candidate division CSSED10-310 bacterium]
MSRSLVRKAGGVSPVEILLLSIALAADAFSVGSAVGFQSHAPRQIFRLSWHFGLFQALMIWLGLSLGDALLSEIALWDHWVAWLCLCLIGIKMITEAFRRVPGIRVRDSTRGLSLLGLSLSVSIDALAAGMGIAALPPPVLLTVILVGFTSLAATWISMLIARKLKQWVGRSCEVGAGIILILIGFQILMRGLQAR